MTGWVLWKIVVNRKGIQMNEISEKEFTLIEGGLTNKYRKDRPNINGFWEDV